jgi:tellurite resistance protein
MEDNGYLEVTSPTGSGADRQNDPWNLLWALNMVAAVVARADGRVHAVERLRLSSYLRCFEIEGLKSPLARGLFDKCVVELERNPASERRALTDRLTGFDGTPWASVILRAAEHVAAADGTVGDAEARAIKAVRVALRLPAGIPERYAACVLWLGRA